MKPELTKRKQSLQEILTQIACIDIEITIRGDKSFTLSFEGKRNMTAENRLTKYFAPSLVSMKIEHDAELEFTCIFIEA